VKLAPSTQVPTIKECTTGNGKWKSGRPTNENTNHYTSNF
jgi:hypothetical protein